MTTATKTKRQTRIFRSQPVSPDEIRKQHEAVRQIIFTFGCYCTDMKFTLDQVVAAFGFERHKAWMRIQELQRAEMVRTTGETKNRCRVYQIATVETI